MNTTSLGALAPAAGGNIDLGSLEPSAGGGVAIAGGSEIACANSFLNNEACEVNN